MYWHYRLTNIELYIIFFITSEAAEKLMHEITWLILTDRTPKCRIIFYG